LKERSWKARDRSQKTGKIEFGEGAINCVVRNMTNLGLYST